MKVSIPAEVVFRELAGEGLLMHMGAGTYFGLDAVGTRIWHLLVKHGYVDPVVTALHRDYAVDKTVLRGDVDRLLKALAKNGLVHLEKDSAPRSSRAR